MAVLCPDKSGNEKQQGQEAAHALGPRLRIFRHDAYPRRTVGGARPKKELAPFLRPPGEPPGAGRASALARTRSRNPRNSRIKE